MICVTHYVKYKKHVDKFIFLYMYFEYRQLPLIQKHLGAVSLDGLNEEH